MKRFNNILCVAAPGERDEATLERAVSLAENNQARLTVADVIPRLALGRLPEGVPHAEVLAERVRSTHAEALQRFVEPFQGRVPIRCEVLTGTAFLEIVRAVLRDGHDLLIKSAENPPFVARLFGSVDMHLLRKCPCPVWLTGPNETPNHARIMAAVDFDPDEPEAAEDDLNTHILETACSLALSDFAELHVVHIWEAPGESLLRSWADDPNAALSYVAAVRASHQRGLDRLRDKVRGLLGETSFNYLNPHFHLQRGVAAERIPEVAQELKIDLVVMGTIARAGIPGLFIGNTAELVLERLQCSVLAIKPRGFVSPVSLPDA